MSNRTDLTIQNSHINDTLRNFKRLSEFFKAKAQISEDKHNQNRINEYIAENYMEDILINNIQ